MANEISDKYVKLTQREHVLMRPDTYIGSVNKDVKQLFVASNYKENINQTKMIYGSYEYSPGFIKIFDEIITNASDHAIRTENVTYIKVTIKDDVISVENDGPGIPIIMHDKEQIYIPELIFGHLLAGENFQDTEDRYVGGRNGIGAKTTNIFSKYFEVDTADGKNKYLQIFTDNMMVVKQPKIKKSKNSYTKITYKPDFEKFSMDGIDDITMSILIKRVFDIAAYNTNVKVYFNDSLICIKSFKDYIKLFPNSEDEMFYEKINDNWEIGLVKSPIDLFTNVSMVNGISTIIGGTHVNYIINNMVAPLKTSLERGVKGVNIKVNDIKNRVLLFVNCKLPNPTFDTQTKENLTLRLVSTITKDVNISDAFLKKVAKSEIFTDLVELSMMKEKLEAQKELNKQVGKRIRVDKLVDANNAGKLGKSQDCHILLTEGDCLHEDTLICVLRDSEKINIKIKDIKIDDIVITHNSNFRHINNISKKIEKSVKIELKNNEILICSENHRWYVYDTYNNNFIFIKTKYLDLKKHKLLLNKNINFDSFIKINDIIDISDIKYNKIIKINNEEILSTNEHKFSIFDISENKIKMVECMNLNKDIHFLINYTKI